MKKLSGKIIALLTYLETKKGTLLIFGLMPIIVTLPMFLYDLIMIAGLDPDDFSEYWGLIVLSILVILKLIQIFVTKPTSTRDVIKKIAFSVLVIIPLYSIAVFIFFFVRLYVYSIL